MDRAGDALPTTLDSTAPAITDLRLRTARPTPVETAHCSHSLTRTVGDHNVLKPLHPQDTSDRQPMADKVELEVPIDGNPDPVAPAPSGSPAWVPAGRLGWGYMLAVGNVVLDAYGALLVKRYATHMSPWDICLVRFGSAFVQLSLISLAVRALLRLKPCIHALEGKSAAWFVPLSCAPVRPLPHLGGTGRGGSGAAKGWGHSHYTTPSLINDLAPEVRCVEGPHYASWHIAHTGPCSDFCADWLSDLLALQGLQSILSSQPRVDWGVHRGREDTGAAV